MADEGVGAAVLEAPVVSEQENVAGESTESTERTSEKQPPEKKDGRKQPDAMRKHAAELKRQAAEELDPVKKQDMLDRAKRLNDGFAKLGAYEEVYPTVHAAREVRALLDAVGGKDGVQQMQTTLSEIEQIDNALSAGDPSVVDRMWDDAPEGMPKLMPVLLDKFAKVDPAGFEKFIATRSIDYLDQVEYPQAFDRMVQLYDAGKIDEAQAIRNELIKWVRGNRQSAQQQKQADPEVERLRAELAKRDQGQESQQVDAAYNEVVTHAGPAIDKAARPFIGKLGLSREEAGAFRQAVWNHLQETRNAHADYKTIAPSKQRQGYSQWSDYAKRWTTDNAEDSIRAVLKTPPWSRIAAGSKTAPKPVTKSPASSSVQTGKSPAPADILYGPAGVAVLKKAGLWARGYRELGDAIMDGVAPMKAGGIRKWR